MLIRRVTDRLAFMQHCAGGPNKTLRHPAQWPGVRPRFGDNKTRACVRGLQPVGGALVSSFTPPAASGSSESRSRMRSPAKTREPDSHLLTRAQNIIRRPSSEVCHLQLLARARLTLRLARSSLPRQRSDSFSSSCNN